MNTPTNPNDGLNDDDMRSLFDAHDSDTPPELDAAILSAAHQAIENPKSTVESQSAPKHRASYWPQGLSVAAVLVLAVLLVPLLVSSPKSSLELATEASMDRSASTTNAVSESRLSSNKPVVQEEALASSNKVMEAEADVVAQVPSSSADIVDVNSGKQTANRRASAMSTINPEEITAAGSAIAKVDVSRAQKLSRAAIFPIDSQQALVSYLGGLTYQFEKPNTTISADDKQAKHPISTLRFTGNRFTWRYQGLLKKGTVQFVDKDQFIAQLPDEQLIIRFDQDAIWWDGLRHEAR